MYASRASASTSRVLTVDPVADPAQPRELATRRISETLRQN